MSLVGHWGFQDNAASTTVLATVGSNATSTTNTSTLTDTGPGGSYTSALHFNGSTQYVALPSFVGTLGDNASFCMWVKLDAATPASATPTGFVNLGPSASGGTSHYPYTDGTCYISTLRFSNNTTHNRVSFSPSGSVTRSNWHHVAITTTPGANGWKFYQNGDLVSQQTGITGVYYDTDLWAIAGSSDSGTANYFLDGSVADVRIYSHTLSEGDIETIMTDVTGGGGGDTRARLIGGDLFRTPLSGRMLIQ